jgi:hypothetical protein
MRRPMKETPIPPMVVADHEDLLPRLAQSQQEFGLQVHTFRTRLEKEQTGPLRRLKKKKQKKQDNSAQVRTRR